MTLKPAIEIDENGNRNRNMDYKIKRQKATDPDKGDSFLDIFRAIN